MSPVRKLSQRRRSVFSAVVPLVAALLLVVGPSKPADAEELYVVTAGGTDELEVLTVDAPVDGEPTIDSSTPLALQLSDGELATYTDIAVLPGGQRLLADGAGRGAVVFDEDGQETDALFGPGTADAPSSAVVARYIDADRPEKLLLAEQSTGQARIYDVIDEAFEWSTTVTRDGISGDVVGAVLLPDDRIAVAANWANHQIGTVEVHSLDDEESTPDTVVISETDEPDSDETDSDEPPVVDGLYPIRDIFADLDGRLLITSERRVHIVGPDGTVEWQMRIGDAPAFGGEFETAHWLASDLVVVATREPGLWNNPHPNHQLHLVDPSADEPHLAAGPSLDAAPLAIDSADGHGATGTRDYYAGVFDFDESTPDELLVDEGPTVEPTAVPLDEAASLSFRLSNPTDDPVMVRRAHFRVAPTTCDDVESSDELATAWWSRHQSRSIEAGDEWRVDDSSMPAQLLSVDSWCGRLVLIGRDGTSHVLGPATDIEILAPGDGEKTPVETDDVFRFGPDAGIPGDSGDGEEPTGCGCTSTGASSPLLIAVIVAGLFVALRRLPGRRYQESPP